MLATLGVCEIGAVILVDCETESTFEASNVIFEDVGIFVQVDSLKGKFSKSLSSIGVCCRLTCDTSSSELGTCAILVVHDEGLLMT